MLLCCCFAVAVTVAVTVTVGVALLLCCSVAVAAAVLTPSSSTVGTSKMTTDHEVVTVSDAQFALVWLCNWSW